MLPSWLWGCGWHYVCHNAPFVKDVWIIFKCGIIHINTLNFTFYFLFTFWFFSLSLKVWLKQPSWMFLLCAQVYINHFNASLHDYTMQYQITINAWNKCSQMIMELSRHFWYSTVRILYGSYFMCMSLTTKCYHL